MAIILWDLFFEVREVNLGVIWIFEALAMDYLFLLLTLYFSWWRVQEFMECFSQFTRKEKEKLFQIYTRVRY
jgi:hypothetical protein